MIKPLKILIYLFLPCVCECVCDLVYNTWVYKCAFVQRPKGDIECFAPSYGCTGVRLCNGLRGHWMLCSVLIHFMPLSQGLSLTLEWDWHLAIPSNPHVSAPHSIKLSIWEPGFKVSSSSVLHAELSPHLFLLFRSLCF